MDGRRRVRWPVVDDGMWIVRVVHLQFPMTFVNGHKGLCSVPTHVYTSQVGLNVLNSLHKLQLLH